MTPRHHRWFFAGYGLVAAVVAANAFLQPPRHAHLMTPAPAKQQAPQDTVPVARVEPKARPADTAPAAPAPVAVRLATVSEPVRVTGRMPSANVVGQLPLPSAVDGDAAVVREVQKALVDAGYGPLVVNGTAGPLTRAAIMGYEHDHALALTGEASSQLLARLGAKTPVAARDPDARKIVTQEAEQVVLIVQTSLKTLGHGAGRVDGRMTTDTEAAIRAFESAANMTPSGRITADLFSQLARRRGENGG